jgi:hypothetical protein
MSAAYLQATTICPSSSVLIRHSPSRLAVKLAVKRAAAAEVGTRSFPEDQARS